MGPPFVFPSGPGKWALSSAGVEVADEVDHSVGTRSCWPA